MSKIEINHNGPIQSTEWAPHTEQPKLILKPDPQPPKQPQPTLEIRYDEKEQWYVVADGIIFMSR